MLTCDNHLCGNNRFAPNAAKAAGAEQANAHEEAADTMPEAPTLALKTASIFGQVGVALGDAFSLCTRRGPCNVPETPLACARVGARAMCRGRL